MGLQDLSLRLTDVEASSDYVRRWVEKNDTTLTQAAGLAQRVSALEGTEITSYVAVSKDYAKLFGPDGLGFLFFTDPHNFSDNIQYYQLLQQLKTIGILYKNSPARFVLCGGDMININHTVDDAKYFLGRIPNLLRREIAEKIHIAPGNHDLNAHHSPAAPSRILTEEQLAEIWYGKKVSYYYFIEENTKCFIFDSGVMTPDMTEYRWKQVDWFANQLLENNIEHVFGLIHIAGTVGGDSDKEAELSQHITRIADAFNMRQSITVNDITYDFSNAFGTFHFMLAGHFHYDRQSIINNIPVLYTKNEMVCDMCFVNWETNMLQAIRYPRNATNNRTLPIIYTGPSDNDLPIWGITTQNNSSTIDHTILRDVNSNQTTRINSTNYTGEIIVTQSTSDDNYSWSNYRNGFISICVAGLKSNRSYRITADCIINNNPLNNNNLLFFSRVNDGESEGTTTTITDGKIDVIIPIGDANSQLQIYMRLGGKSLTISNLKFKLIEE